MEGQRVEFKSKIAWREVLQKLLRNPLDSTSLPQVPDQVPCEGNE